MTRYRILLHSSLIYLFICCSSPGVNKITIQTQEKQIQRIEIEMAEGSDIDRSTKPRRMYATREGEDQRGTQLILKLRKLDPGTKVYWSFRFVPGPGNSEMPVARDIFSGDSGFDFKSDEFSTVANDLGETGIRFTGTTYAGDSFQFGAGFIQGRGMSDRFKKSAVKTEFFSVWKRLIMETPKILKNVLFPISVMEIIHKALAEINIELNYPRIPAEPDPFSPPISSYFFPAGGNKQKTDVSDPRYGPRSPYSEDRQGIFQKVAEFKNDSNRDTINLIVLGAYSEDSDLIKKERAAAPGVPRPVDYRYNYRKEDIDLREIPYGSVGMGIFMGGDSPTIFIWSDFWWMISRVLKTSHRKVLGRVILHELGHYILSRQKGSAAAILDSDGHVLEKKATRKSIMGGFGPIQSPDEIRAERNFINRLRWHPEIEKLIRKNFISSPPAL